MYDTSADVRAYIDAANLHKGVGGLGWKLDYRRFRGWLRQKFGVTEALVFIGFMPERAGLYSELKSVGYRMVFKEMTYGAGGVPKGNCDADLVLKAARDHFEAGITGAILVSSDGDYAPLVRFYQEKKVPCVIVSPSSVKGQPGARRCSWLLRKTNAPIICLNDVKVKIALGPQSERAPGADVSAQGPLSS